LSATLIFFAPFLTGSNLFGFRDLSLYFYPLRHLMVETIRSGHLPLWNPYIYCGIPFFATLQAGFLYPFSLLFYILPFNLGFNWFIILHYFLAAYFTYLLMKHYGVGEEGSITSGLVFAFSGYLLSVANMNTTLTSVVWLPLVLLCWDEILTPCIPSPHSGEGTDATRLVSSPLHGMERGIKGVRLVLILLLVLMFLGGEPTIFYSTIILMVLYAFFKDQIAKILYLGPVLLFVFGLLAVQILPMAEYISSSVRMWRTEYGFITQGSFPIREVLNFIFPNFWGNFLTGTHSQVLLGERGQTWILSSYIGILPLFLAGLAFLRPTRLKWFYLTGAVLFLFLAFGHYTPFYKLAFYALPGLSAIRYPVKFLFFPTFAAAVLAGWGVDKLAEDLKPRAIIIFAWMVGALFLLATLLGMFLIKMHTFISLKFKLTEDLKFLLAKLMMENQVNLFYAFLLMAIALTLMVLLYRKLISGKMLVYGIIAVTAVQLFVFNYAVNSPVSSQLTHYFPINLSILEKDRSLFRFYVDHEVAEKSGSYFNDQNEVLSSLKSKLEPNMLVPYHLQDFYGRESIEPLGNVRYYWAFREKYTNKKLELLSRANVKYILAFKPIKNPKLKLLSDKELYLYQNLGCYPRVYMQGSRPVFAKASADKCEVRKYESNRIEIETNSRSGGKLVLSDNYYPGWKARIDGKLTPISREQYLFRSVQVPAGKHRVVFTYEPDSLKLGALISLVSLVGLVGIAGWGKYRRWV